MIPRTITSQLTRPKCEHVSVEGKRSTIRCLAPRGAWSHSADFRTPPLGAESMRLQAPPSKIDLLDNGGLDAAEARLSAIRRVPA